MNPDVQTITATENTRPNGAQAPQSAAPRPPVVRHRHPLNVTLRPETLAKLAFLARFYECSRSQVLELLTETDWQKKRHA